MSYLVNNKILHAQDNNKEHLINNLFELIKKQNLPSVKSPMNIVKTSYSKHKTGEDTPESNTTHLSL